MRPGLAQMRGRHHPVERGFDGTCGIAQKCSHPRQRLVGFGIEDMEDRADQQRMTGLFPMVAPFERTFGIDQHVGDVLHIAHFPFAAPDFEQGVIGA